MCWLFAATLLVSLLNIVGGFLHPRSRTLLANVLVGPIFYTAMAAICGTALWAIWEDKPRAGWWAVAASSAYLVDFVRQFMVPMRPAWDHRVSSLLAGIVGLVEFSWRDKRVDSTRSDETDPA
jgi:hypothetical protein